MKPGRAPYPILQDFDILQLRRRMLEEEAEVNREGHGLGIFRLVLSVAVFFAGVGVAALILALLKH